MPCSYCETSTNLIKCLDCHQSFCNTFKGTTISHILFHLKKNNHKRIFVGGEVACKCGCSDVFLLVRGEGCIECINCFRRRYNGHINSAVCKSENNNDNVIGTGKSDKCNGPLYVVDGKALAEWVYGTNTESLVTSEFLQSITREKKYDDSTFAIGDILSSNGQKLPRVQLKYTIKEYISIFSKLITAECEQERENKDRLARDKIKIQFRKEDRGVFAYFRFGREDFARINIGDEIRIYVSDTNIFEKKSRCVTLKGFICNDNIYTEENVAEIVDLNGNIVADGEYRMEFPWRNVGYQRMKRALINFKKKCDGRIASLILKGKMKKTRKGHKKSVNEEEDIVSKNGLGFMNQRMNVYNKHNDKYDDNNNKYDNKYDKYSNDKRDYYNNDNKYDEYNDDYYNNSNKYKYNDSKYNVSNSKYNDNNNSKYNSNNNNNKYNDSKYNSNESVNNSSLLSCSNIKIEEPDNMPVLNSSQKIAINAALTNSVTLIQGPPGTGKTITTAAIVYNLLKKKKGRILVVAPSNIAVDNLARRIIKCNIDVLRIVSRNREGLISDLDDITLHKRVMNEIERMKKGERSKFDDDRVIRPILNKWRGIKEEYVMEMNKKDDKNEVKENDLPNGKVKEVKDRLRYLFLKESKIITCTCVTAGQEMFQRFKFPYVLIDEAVQATEPLTLVPLIYSCKKLILVGDHKQLGPTILNKKAANAGLKISLFERMIKLGVVPYLLTVQYRMHPVLCEWVSNTFYDGALVSGAYYFDSNDVNKNNKVQNGRQKCCDYRNVSKWFNLCMPTFFYVCRGDEQLFISGTSYLNIKESEQCLSIIRHLKKKNVQERDIGIITPYEGQRVLLSTLTKCEVANVDAFQGREKPFIIISLVRSNNINEIGFVSDCRRMCVALTRAKYGLFIVGNPSTFLKDKKWKDLIMYYQEKNLLVEGEVEELRVCRMVSESSFDFGSFLKVLN